MVTLQMGVSSEQNKHKKEDCLLFVVTLACKRFTRNASLSHKIKINDTLVSQFQ